MVSGRIWVNSHLKIGQFPELSVVAVILRREMAVPKPYANSAIVTPRGVEMVRVGLVMRRALCLSIVGDLD